MRPYVPALLRGILTLTFTACATGPIEAAASINISPNDLTEACPVISVSVSINGRTAVPEFRASRSNTAVVNRVYSVARGSTARLETACLATNGAVLGRSVISYVSDGRAAATVFTITAPDPSDARQYDVREGVAPSIKGG